MSVSTDVGYVGLFAWVFLAEAGVPLLVPTELLLIGAGAAAAPDLSILALVVAVSLAADLLGTTTLFILVRSFGRHPEFAPGWLSRPVGWATSKAKDVSAGRVRRIALARSIPLLRVPAAGAAGLVDLALTSYLVSALIGGLVWVALFAGGAYLVAANALPFT